MTSTPSFTFFCSLLLVFPVLVGFLFRKYPGVHSYYLPLLGSIYGCKHGAFRMWSHFRGAHIPCCLRYGLRSPPRWVLSPMTRMCARRPSEVHTPIGATFAIASFSVVHTLPGSSDVGSGALLVCNLPRTFHTTKGAPHSWMGRRLEWLLQENSPNCPRVSLFLTFSF